MTRHGAPIYVQLSTLFRRFIVTGQWPVGAQIPIHEEIAAQFDVNPATVRKAIGLLADEGLVQRFRRRGTFVTAKPSTGQVFALPTTWNALLTAHEHSQVSTLETGVVASVPAPFHGKPRQAKGYRFLERLHRMDGRAIAIEEIYLDQAIRWPKGRAALDPLVLAARAGVDRADQTVRFGIADRSIAAALGLALNEPIAVVHVSVVRAGVLRYESVCRYRGDAMRLAEPIRFGGRR